MEGPLAKEKEAEPEKEEAVKEVANQQEVVTPDDKKTRKKAAVEE